MHTTDCHCSTVRLIDVCVSLFRHASDVADMASAVDECGNTALHSACQMEDKKEAAPVPLLCALIQKVVVCRRCLLAYYSTRVKHHCSTNDKVVYAYSPSQAGVDVTLRNRFGQTSADVARSSKMSVHAQLLDRAAEQDTQAVSS